MTYDITRVSSFSVLFNIFVAISDGAIRVIEQEKRIRLLLAKHCCM